MDADDYDGNADDGDGRSGLRRRTSSARCASPAGSACAFRIPFAATATSAKSVRPATTATSTWTATAAARTARPWNTARCAPRPKLSPSTAASQGGTLRGRRRVQASCQLGVARGHSLYGESAGAGTTRALRDVRDDAGRQRAHRLRGAESELGCSYSFGGPSLVLQLAEAPPAPLTVLVNAYTVLEDGPFTLTAEFTPQVCGDGLTIGARSVRRRQHGRRRRLQRRLHQPSSTTLSATRQKCSRLNVP